MEACDGARMNELEKENAVLNKMFAEGSVEITAMKNLIEKSCIASGITGSCLFFCISETAK